MSEVKCVYDLIEGLIMSTFCPHRSNTSQLYSGPDVLKLDIVCIASALVEENLALFLALRSPLYLSSKAHLKVTPKP